jgi:hypothetical protein
MILTKTEIDINTLETEIYRYCCELGREILKTIITRLDNKLMLERDRGEYRHKGNRGTVLKTIMGEVEYERTIYEHKGENGTKNYVYLLDEALGFNTIGFVSDMLAERIAETSCEMSYRETAQAVSKLTGQMISHTGAWNVVQALGEKLDKKECRAAALAKAHHGEGTNETKLLFEEQDGVYLNLQGKDRKKVGNSAEMKVAIAYTGAKKTGKKRYNLIGKVACANFEGIDSFFSRKEGVIAETYNVDEIDKRVVNGDGANWIKRSVTDETVHYQLDTFHRNKAIMQNVSDPEARKTIFKLLYSKQIDLLLKVIDAYSNSTGDPKEQENYLQLLQYFQNNKDGLISYNRRGLDLPTPPDGAEYRGCGAMESNIYTIISHRMKHRRANWSIRGGNNLARLLTLKATGKLSEVVSGLVSTTLSPQYAEEVQTVLSSSKISERIGKGYNGFSKSTIPTTLKWMKDLFALKPLY